MNYKIIKHNNKSFIVIPRLMELGLNHCFTSIDMDLGTKTNNSIKNISLSLKEAYQAIGIRPSILFSGEQVHSDRVQPVRNISDGEENAFGRYLPATDGLITSKKNIALISRYADCIPILLYDPIKKVQANIHSGWKGTLKEIAIKGIMIMREQYACNPKDLIIGMGPAIDRDNFEVDQDVMELFKNKFSFYEEFIRERNNKFLIDLKYIYFRLFKEEGIKEENIIDINLSTYSTNYLHSYRRDKENFGLMGVISSIK